MAKSAAARMTKAKKPKEPRLGIFWLVKGRLLIDSVPLSECETYADHLIYPPSHVHLWEQWQKLGKVPTDSDYDEYARGRVMCNAKKNEFTLLADRCILKQKKLIAEIKKLFCLPTRTLLNTDLHYRCFQCLHGNEDVEE
jgi:hypothetical protein